MTSPTGPVTTRSSVGVRDHDATGPVGDPRLFPLTRRPLRPAEEDPGLRGPVTPGGRDEQATTAPKGIEMTWRERLANYRRQTGRIGPTPRQSRRLIKKQRRYSPPKEIAMGSG